jgi:hypothetical protein
MLELEARGNVEGTNGHGPSVVACVPQIIVPVVVVVPTDHKRGDQT